VGVGAGRQQSTFSRLVLGPYLLLLAGVWHIARVLSREPPYNTLVPGILVGRRPFPTELPSKVRSVVDLTAEFPAQWPSSITYLNVQVLDASAVCGAELLKATREVAALPRPVFIHCAQGHGRTATLAAALLLLDGHVDTPQDAQNAVSQARPLAVPNGNQCAALEAFASLLRKPSRPME